MTTESHAGRPPENPLVKLALELGPLVVFFAANSKFGIFTATAVFMVAMVISLTLSWVINRRLAIMPLVTGAVVLVFGTLTLVLHDDTFIKMKPTIVNGLFAVVLLGGLLFNKYMLGYVFDGAFKLDEAGWRKLTINWGLFFVFLAVVNEVVWRTQSTDFWVAFKVWGIMPITLAFSASQLPIIMKHTIEPPEEKSSVEPSAK